MKLDNFTIMVKVGGYIQWAQLAGLELKFPITQYLINYTSAMSDTSLYSVSYGLQDLWRISAYDLLETLLSIAFDLSGNSPILGASDDLPKFIHYAAHAETLSEMFEALDIERAGRSFPSSAIFFEFVATGPLKFPEVRLQFYDGGSQKVEPLNLPGQKTATIPLLDFAEYILERLKNAGGYDMDVEAKC